MTEAPLSPNAEAPARAPTSVERLEFGKFCVSADGPVERDRENIPIEHGQLGHSDGFPEGLARFCDPTVLGISAGERDQPPAGAPHGTVLRPVVLEGVPHQIFYRVRARPEDGEGKPGRRYLLARYLVARDGAADPLTLLDAMGAPERLQGITRADGVNLEPLSGWAAPPPHDPTIVAFCREAVIYVLSGVPVNVAADLASERQFFSCVAALWLLLPQELRPHLSAGWCVGDSFAGQLTVANTAHRSGDCALFDLNALTWTGPEYVTILNAHYQPVRRPFYDGRLEPGRFYLEYFVTKRGPWPVNLAQALDDLALSALARPFPSSHFPELPDWQDLNVIRAFRNPGLKAEDEYALSVLKEWLTTGGGETKARRYLDARRRHFQKTRERALDLMIDAEAQAESRARGDRALWFSLSGKCPDSFIEHLTRERGRAGAARALLIAALSQQDTSAALVYLHEAATRGESDRLLADTLPHLNACLDESLSPTHAETLVQHARLLELPAPPAEYCAWVLKRPLLLMCALALTDKLGEEPHGRIRTIAGTSAVHALYDLLYSPVPPAPVAFEILRQLPPAERQIFIDIFNHEWERLDDGAATRRERLLPWFHVLKPDNPEHPLLRIAAGEPVLPSQLDQLAREIEHRGTPSSLLVDVSTFALREWGRWGQRIAEKEYDWFAVISLWPARLRRALGLRSAVDSSAQLDPKIADAAQAFIMSADELNELVKARRLHPTFDHSAPDYWEWALRLPTREIFHPQASRPVAVEMCAYLERGELPPKAPATREEVDVLVQLAQAVGIPKRLRDVSKRRWREAEGWQLMLLLLLFPEENFQPSAEQLGRLVRYQPWLRSHLDNQRVSRARREAFRLATVPFHHLSYREAGMGWNDAYATYSVVWAAFRGAPLMHLREPGKLMRALDDYTEAAHPSADESEQREIKAEMCRIFLEAYVTSPTLDRALKKVLYEFLLPQFKEREAENIFADAEAYLHGDNRRQRIAQEWYLARPQLVQLLEVIVRHANSKFIGQSLSDFYHRR
jgi:hypothetical protein